MSGVKTAMTGSILQWTQDTNQRGIIELGLPGVGKSEIAKAIGNMYGKPVIAFNISDMESGIIGSSNENLRQAQAIVDAVSDKKVFSIATCNKIDSLPPELRRRFAEAIFFFDAPTQTERASIWQVYREKYNISVSEALPNDEGWTGAEIKECVLKAYRLGITLIEASEYIIPVTVSSADTIDTLRRSSSGKYLSASNPGIYRYNGPQMAATADVEAESTGRRMR
jgi:SpoVK/Ycf46/Vps4 family AAA+-type ATPase